MGHAFTYDFSFPCASSRLHIVQISSNSPEIVKYGISGRHIVALEHDVDIFNKVLMPMQDPKPLLAHSTSRGRALIPDETL